MPLVNFRPAPGINKEVTDYTGEGKWTDGDNVRFFQGLPQKIKGWEKFIPTTLVGVARDQHAWVALDGTRYNALGTDRKLYVLEDYYQCNNICFSNRLRTWLCSRKFCYL
jgi:hypothetical protein